MASAEQDPDAALMLRVKQGDTAAFEQLVEKYKKPAPPPETLLQTELEVKINEALDELPENQRTAITLCRQNELSYEDIAKVLKTSVSATKSLIHRGRESLKQKLKPYLKTGQ